MVRTWFVVVVVIAVAGTTAADPKPTPPPGSRGMPKDYACAPGTADRKAGACVCPAGKSASRDQRDFAVCVGTVMADPCADQTRLADLETKADEAMTAGKWAAALSTLEVVYRCKPTVIQKTYFAACRAKAFPKAQAYFSRIVEGKQDALAQICMKEGFDPRVKVIASSESPCACENSVGVPIEETHCGYEICGTDRQVYQAAEKPQLAKQSFFFMGIGTAEFAMIGAQSHGGLTLSLLSACRP